MRADTRRGTKRNLVASAVLVVAFASALAALAQNVDPRYGRTVVLGTPRGSSPTDRVDARRTGFTETPLPTGGLRVAWRKVIGSTIDFAPLVDARGTSHVVTARGEVVAIAEDGTEKWRASTAAQGGPATLLSDGTVAFVSGGGEVIGVRDRVVRFRTKTNRNDATSQGVSPLALADGGLVTGSQLELTLFDSEGGIRGRVTLPEALAHPLVSAMGKVVAIGVSGVVYTWAPGAASVTRVGSFGGPINRGAALEGDRTLIAVSAAQHQVSALDITRGTLVPRASAAVGLFMGPVALRGTTAHLLELSATNVAAVAYDGLGQEVLRVIVGPNSLPISADGGIAPLTTPPHVGSVVDGAGTMAFASPDGTIGVVNAAGAGEVLPESLCGRSVSLRSGTMGIAPAGPMAFVVACASGTVARVVSATR